MFIGLARAFRCPARLRSPETKPLPRVHPGLYGDGCVRGSSASCYRRIRRARLARRIPRPGPAPAWRHWHRPNRWKWRQSLPRALAQAGAVPRRLPPLLDHLRRSLQRAIPASRLAQWCLSYGLPALVLVAGEVSQLFTFNGEKEKTPVASLSTPSPAVPPEPLAMQWQHPPAAPPSEPVPEPQPLLADAAADPFPILARSHFNRSLATHEALRRRRDVFVAMARAETARRLAEEEALARQSFASQKVVAQALRVGTLRLEGDSEATLHLEIYDSFEALEKGDPDHGPQAEIFSVDLSGQRSETLDRYGGFTSTGGPIEITNYGYGGDYTSDRNSNHFATGLGGTRPLIPGISAALSRSLANKLNAKPGAVIEFIDRRGKTYLVTYDDHSPQRNLNIDVYRPTFGSNYFRSHVKAARIVRQGESGTSHGKDGLPFSLQNYRAALLQRAAENRPSEAAAPSASPEALAVAPPISAEDEFDLVADPLPLALRLDQFADIPFADTGFETSPQISRYLEAGAQALRQGVALVRKHGLKPEEFPPILRMQANLEEAQESLQTIVAGETRLRLAYHECEAEIFRMRLQASMEESPAVLAEVQGQIVDLECTRTDILTQIEEHRGGLHPAVQDRPTGVAATRDSWDTLPDS